MRKYIDINLGERTISSRELHGREIAECGRYLIAKMLLKLNIAEVAPLAPENPLIFSAGPFAGTNFSNANRLSVGCKSPLTGGVKEANSGGTFAFAMGQLQIAGISLHGASDQWVIIRITKDNGITFDDATLFKGTTTSTTILFKGSDVKGWILSSTSTSPGQIAFTRIPFAPSSLARHRVRCKIPDLAT